MKKILLLVFVFALVPLFAQAQLFTPGNIIFADPFYSPDGQIVELSYDEAAGTATIINVVRWDQGGFERRRALGLDVDPNGNVWVGITSTGDTEAEFPLGLGEALRIERDGTQTFFLTDLIKITFLVAIGPNQVIVQSNNDADYNLAQLVDATSGEAALTNFNKTSYGEALLLPDGRLLMGDNGVPGIHIYEMTGGDPIGVFYDDGRPIQSMTYNEQIGSIIALNQNNTLLRISLDGTLEAEYDTSEDGFTGLWGVAQIPGTTNIILGSHNVDDTFNEMAIYDATDFSQVPTVLQVVAGFEEAGLPADHVFRSFFNIAVVPEITDVRTWELQ